VVLERGTLQNSGTLLRSGIGRGKGYTSHRTASYAQRDAIACETMGMAAPRSATTHSGIPHHHHRTAFTWVRWALGLLLALAAALKIFQYLEATPLDPLGPLALILLEGWMMLWLLMHLHR
jgi:hypothetical protein